MKIEKKESWKNVWCRKVNCVIVRRLRMQGSRHPDQWRDPTVPLKYPSTRCTEPIHRVEIVVISLNNYLVCAKMWCTYRSQNACSEYTRNVKQSLHLFDWIVQKDDSLLQTSGNINLSIWNYCYNTLIWCNNCTDARTRRARNITTR